MTFWNHNSHYHNLILSQLPDAFDRALDIGSGSGDFAIRLAKRAHKVDAVELDPKAILIARERCASFENINLITADFLDYSFGFEQYDIVTALAAVHHMDLEESLERIKQVLRPGGTLAVLGLYRNASVADYGFDVTSILAHQFLSWHNRDNIAPASETALQVQNPAETFTEIKAIANRSMPGAIIQRRLLWRYTLFWKKPERNA